MPSHHDTAMFRVQRMRIWRGRGSGGKDNSFGGTGNKRVEGGVGPQTPAQTALSWRISPSPTFPFCLMPARIADRFRVQGEHMVYTGYPFDCQIPKTRIKMESFYRYVGIMATKKLQND